jgi:DNA-binding response OmpR family regulator
MSSEKPSILVIDDDIGPLRLAGRLLTRNGFRVEMALGGHEGARRLSAQSFDLLITDWKCGGGDAERMITLAKEANSNVRILLLSGDRDIEAVARDLGVDDYLGKPFEFDTLVAAVYRALSRSERS